MPSEPSPEQTREWEAEGAELEGAFPDWPEDVKRLLEQDQAGQSSA